jgi:hypothetical protein
MNRKNFARYFPHLAAIASCLAACTSVQAQSSWWDKYATPPPPTVSGKPHPAEPRVKLDDGPNLGPALFGAVQLIGPHGCPIPANVLGHPNAQGVYLVQTRQGIEYVPMSQIYDPLRGGYPYPYRGNIWKPKEHSARVIE